VFFAVAELLVTIVLRLLSLIGFHNYCLVVVYHFIPVINIGLCPVYGELHYSVSQKVAPLKQFAVFSLLVNMCN